MNRIYISVILSFFLFCGNADASKRKKQEVDTLSLSCRGVMENFQNVFDGMDSRLDFYKEEGLTHYFYCPSDDKYCNRWGWKFLYNDEERMSIRRLNGQCKDKGLEFVWTINPGGSYEWNKEDYKFLLDKLIMMYYNGIRSFAVDFTDNPGEYKSVRDSLVKDFVLTRKDHISLYMVDEIPLVEYPSEGHSAVESLMRGYHFDNEFISQAKKTDGILCRLSASDEFAKLAVASAADFSADPDKYSADQSMADAVSLMHGDVREAFITFLRHTGKVEESSSIRVFSLETWSSEKSDLLYAEFDRIERVPELIGKNTDSEVFDALQPWLAEFGRLGTRGKEVLECMGYYINGNLGDFWKKYLDAVMSPEEIRSYEAHPVAADKLQPFCTSSLLQMKEGFASMLSGKTVLHNLAATLYASPDAALDSDFETSLQADGHIEFAIPAQANTCHLLTGDLPENESVIFRQLGTDGALLAEFVLTCPYTTFDLKEGAVMVDVLGNVEIYETIFVDLHP